MWKIGPECAAQQAAKVSASTMNCGERNASPTEGPAPPAGEDVASAGGGWRISRAAGNSSANAPMPITSIAVRQS